MGGFGDIGKVLGNIGSGSGLAAVINPTAILGTAAAMGDTLFGSYANKKEAARERQWQRYMVDYQNAYNTPAAQMARYAEAGLNPNLIYGQQNYSASTGSVPHANIPGLKIADRVLAALKLDQDIQLGQEQINQIQASTKLLKQQARSAGANADILESLMLDTPAWMDPREKGVKASFVRALVHKANKTSIKNLNVDKMSLDDIRNASPDDIADMLIQGMSR